LPTGPSDWPARGSLSLPEPHAEGRGRPSIRSSRWLAARRPRYVCSPRVSPHVPRRRRRTKWDDPPACHGVVLNTPYPSPFFSFDRRGRCLVRRWSTRLGKLRNGREINARTRAAAVGRGHRRPAAAAPLRRIDYKLIAPRLESEHPPSCVTDSSGRRPR
jgi:hypothetical protein